MNFRRENIKISWKSWFADWFKTILHLNRYLLWRSLGAALGPAGQGLNFVSWLCVSDSLDSKTSASVVVTSEFAFLLRKTRFRTSFLSVLQMYRILFDWGSLPSEKTWSVLDSKIGKHNWMLSMLTKLESLSPIVFCDRA